MKKGQRDSDKQALRKRAEETLQKRWAEASRPSELSPEEAERLIHELQVYQIELEMQNEELRRIEKELEASRNRYADLYDFAPVGYFTISEKGMILEANLTGAAMLAVERGSLIGTPFSRFINRDDQDIFYLHRKKLVETRNKETCELRLVKKDGSGFHGQLECIVTGEKEEGRQIRAAVADITERKRVEQALQESEEHYQSLVENIDLGVTLIDSDHNILMTNAAQCRMFGKSPGHFVGKKCFREFEKRDGICPHCPGVRSMETGRPEEVETEGVRDDGSHFIVRIHAFPILEKDGGTTGFIEVVEEITERKELEAQLQQAQKMEAIGTLAGGIAHDFNNILGIVVGNAELAMDDIPEWSPAQHNLKEVREACLRAKDVARQILTFSRQTEQEQKPVKLGAVVEEALKLLRASIPTTIDINKHLLSRSDTVLADATQIHQVLINLCTNAAHAMEETGGILEVRLEDLEIDKDSVSRYHDLKPGKYVRLTVIDTGHGMAPEIAERIFDPYFTTKEVGKGTGMGLAVVDGIVKSHGGVIAVNSESGKGSTFHVILPALEGEAEPEPESLDAVPTGTERLLIVDDEQPLANLLEKMLERLGYTVVKRMGSLEALEIFRAEADRFDLVITDMTMPHMMGDDLARELMKIRPDIPVILATGHSERIDEAKAEAMGIRAFVMKPFLKRNLAQTVRKVLDEK